MAVNKKKDILVALTTMTRKTRSRVGVFSFNHLLALHHIDVSEDLRNIISSRTTGLTVCD